MVDHLHHGAAAPGLAAPQPAPVDHPGLPPLGAIAAAPGGLSPPLKDEAPELAGVEGFKGKGKADNADCADAAAQRKHFATLAARLALAGHELHRTATDDGPCRYFVTRWGMARDLHDLAAVERFAAQVEAPT